MNSMLSQLAKNVTSRWSSHHSDCSKHGFSNLAMIKWLYRRTILTSKSYGIVNKQPSLETHIVTYIEQLSFLLLSEYLWR